MSDQMQASIVKIWDADYPWDVRVEKVGLALRDAGYVVHLVARNSQGKASDEYLDPFHMHRLAALPWLNGALGFPAFFNPRWIRRIAEVTRQQKAKLLLVRDLPLAPSAIYVAKRFKLPIILDMAENYPQLMRDLWSGPNFRWSDTLVRNPKIVEWVERWVIQHVDHIWTVVEESSDRIIQLGVPPERISVVTNTPTLERVASFQGSGVIAGEKPVAVYMGVMEFHRGIETLLLAVAELKQSGHDWQLLMIGEGRDYEYLQQRAHELGIADRIEWTGWMKNAEVLERLPQCAAGMIPHHVTPAWNSTIPNKLFDYMAAGVPVVASDMKPVERVLRETGAGLCFRDRDASHLAEILRGMIPEAREQYAARGKHAIETRLHWEQEASTIAQTVARLLPSDCE